MKKIFCFLSLFIATNTYAQKKVLDHSDFDIWNRIQKSSISAKGDFVMYSLQKGERDSHLKIKDNQGGLVFNYERSENGQFTFDGKHAVFIIKAWRDSIVEMKRRKVKKDKLPMDTIGIYNLQNQFFQKIANVKSYNCLLYTSDAADE